MRTTDPRFSPAENYGRHTNLDEPIFRQDDGSPPLPSESRPLTGEALEFADGWSWEMDESGRHRVVSPSGVGGVWAGYEQPALSRDGRRMVCAQYWQGWLPTETQIVLSLPEERTEDREYRVLPDETWARWPLATAIVLALGGGRQGRGHEQEMVLCLDLVEAGLAALSPAQRRSVAEALARMGRWADGEWAREGSVPEGDEADGIHSFLRAAGLPETLGDESDGNWMYELWEMIPMDRGG